MEQQQQRQQNENNDAPMTEEEQKQRRASIQMIMKDQNMTPLERRRSIQSLMDGRRRSSSGGTASAGMAAAAALASAANYYDSSDDDDDDDEHMGTVPLQQQQQQQQHHQQITPEQSRRNSFTYEVNNTGIAFNTLSMVATTDDNLHQNNIINNNNNNINNSNVNNNHHNIINNHNNNSNKPVMTMPNNHSINNNQYINNKILEQDNRKARALALSRRMELHRPECTHYDRNCTLIAPCCGAAFGCRICHDECPVLPPPIAAAGHHNQQQSHHHQPSTKHPRSNSMPLVLPPQEDTHHEIDRFAVKEIICRRCFTRQGSKTNNCITCGVQFGQYHCNICNLWMSDEEEPYHCSDCGFCRVGGRDNFRHCHDCGMCIDALLFDDHNCKAGKYMSNCPVCQEDLFSSRSASHEMPCGHAIHWHCFRELTTYDTRCPVCKKTAETHEHMAPTWSAMAMGIALQPIPPELARVVSIICNDCEERDEDRRWHFLGVQCLGCTSFNTTVERTTLMGREAAAFLGDAVQDLQQGIAMTDMLQAAAAGFTNANMQQQAGGRVGRRHSVHGSFTYGGGGTSLLPFSHATQQQQQQSQQQQSQSNLTMTDSEDVEMDMAED